jgi:heat-inducible transcriptional repressor
MSPDSPLSQHPLASSPLTSRQEQVLWATVRHYIATAEPVGSKALVSGYNFGVSPATIRSAMGALEREGFLYQPHTSAGRIPSDSGYRRYVDRLIVDRQPPSERSSERSRQLEAALNSRLRREDWSLEAVLRGATQILATLSGYITLVTLPKLTTAALRHLQLVPMETGRCMLVVVTDAFETQSAVFDLPIDESGDTDQDQVERELQLLSNFLNHQLRSRPMSELANLNWQELGQEFQRYTQQLNGLLEELALRCESRSMTQILISGVSEVLRQPEFSELQQVQTLLHLLEDGQEQLWPLIFQRSNQTPVSIHIGAENPLAPMQSCALISAHYHRGNVPVGSVGVLGPTRMLYEDVIAGVEATAGYLSDVLS